MEYKENMVYAVTTFYKFTVFPEGQLVAIKTALEQQAEKLHVLGLVLIAPEGINATLAGGDQEMKQYKRWLTEQFGELSYKDSSSEKLPFKRFKVKIKPEIVQLKQAEIIPSGRERHLSPEKWDEIMAEEDVVLIDVRNIYEVKLGTFKKAINPKTWKFNQFPQWLTTSGVSKKQKIGIFCTGGIRCEKAAVVMKEQGYEQVYQLEGGILNYIESRPHQNFEGQCFVFDHRVAVDQKLQPTTRYSLCPGCGNGAPIDQTCVVCERSYRMCEDCLTPGSPLMCSRNCRYIYARDYKTA